MSARRGNYPRPPVKKTDYFLSTMYRNGFLREVCPLQAVVTSLPGEDKLTIAVTLAGRFRFLDRPKGELLDRTLTRLQINAAKHGADPVHLFSKRKAEKAFQLFKAKLLNP